VDEPGARYPEIEPYEHGMLDVGDRNAIYWETCGRPSGKPAVVLHGGPGSGVGPGWRRFFDPDAYRVVLFDQRGCGRSTPHASDPATDLSVNTTGHLLADIERLREHLGIDRWLVLGASWGCVLGLTYAERHPDRVSELVLFALATGRRVETELLTRGVGRWFPEAWARFVERVPADAQGGDLAGAYARLMASPDPATRQAAADAWCEWEDAMEPGGGPRFRDDPPEYRMAFARLVTHYWSHGSWLEPDQLLRDAGRLSGIPAVLVQGRLDLGNVLGTPWLLHAALPGSELVLIEDAGHDSSDPVAAALVRATDAFRSGG
jgi:proline iminopeptidase